MHTLRDVQETKVAIWNLGARVAETSGHFLVANLLGTNVERHVLEVLSGRRVTENETWSWRIGVLRLRVKYHETRAPYAKIITANRVLLGIRKVLEPAETLWHGHILEGELWGCDLVGLQGDEVETNTGVLKAVGTAVDLNCDVAADGEVGPTVWDVSILTVPVRIQIEARLLPSSAGHQDRGRGCIILIETTPRGRGGGTGGGRREVGNIDTDGAIISGTERRLGSLVPTELDVLLDGAIQGTLDTADGSGISVDREGILANIRSTRLATLGDGDSFLTISSTARHATTVSASALPQSIRHRCACPTLSKTLRGLIRS